MSTPGEPVSSAHDRTSEQRTLGIRETDLLPMPSRVPGDAAGDEREAQGEHAGAYVPDLCGACGAPRSVRRGPRVARITLGHLPRSMNEREGLMMRRHVWAIRNECKSVYAAIARAAAELDAPATGRRIVQIEFVKSKRSRKRDDPGNRRARSKAILDGLVHAGLLVDDTDEYLVLPPELERKDESGPRTIIDIFEAPLGAPNPPNNDTEGET